MLPILCDGVYALSFRSSHDTSDPATGLAIVRDGCLFGSDPGGCIIHGVLVGPRAPQASSHFEGSISVPPDSELITGHTAGTDGLYLSVQAVARCCAEALLFVADVAGHSVEVTARYVGPVPRDLRVAVDDGAS
jgi:hypothetical protein